MLKNTVIVDGSNIATEGRSTPSLRQLDEAVRAFITDHPTENLVVIVDATFGHRISSSERSQFEEAILAGELITPPAGAIGRGDAFILQIADKADATVLSNDSFQELHAQYPWLFDEGRLIGGKPVPGLGWVFILRTPVRGPTSRRVTREAKADSHHDNDGTGGSDTQGRRNRGRNGTKSTGSEGEAPDVKAQKQTPLRAGSGSTGSRKSDTPINDAVPFLNFIGAHPVGSRVTGTITEFASQGAYAEVEDVKCYIPLRLMGDPAPRSPKDVLKKGEERTFVLFALDPPRRGVDLALVASPRPTPAVHVGTPSDADNGVEVSDSTPEPSVTPTENAEADEGATATAKKAVKKEAGSRKPPAKKVATKKSTAKKAAVKTLATKTATTESPELEAAPTKKAATKKATTKASALTEAVATTNAEDTAGKKAASKKTAKKAAATTAPTEKAASEKPVATKEAAVKKSTAKKAASTTALAKKAPVKKTAVEKVASKKAASEKPAATKEAAAKKSTAKKAASTTALAKKTAVKKATVKKTAVKKATVKKTAVNKSATKTTAEKEPS